MKFNKIIKITIALALAAFVLIGSLSVSAADTFKDYTENKGKIAVIANFNTDGTSPVGKVDKLGTSSKNPDNWLDDVSTLDISYDTSRYLEGDASLKMHVAKTETVTAAGNKTIEFNRTTMQIRDISGVSIPADTSNVYLCFYLYVEKKAQFDYIDLGNSDIELSNSVDSVEYAFKFNKITNQIKNDGWNKIQLSFADAEKMGISGKMNLKRIRIFIFSAGTGGDVDLYFDNMTLETIGQATGGNTSSNSTGTSSNTTSSGFNTVGGNNSNTTSSAVSSTTSTSNTPSIPAASGSLNLKEESSEVTSTEDTESTTAENTSSAPETEKEDNGLLLWIIIGAAALVVLGGGAVAVVLILNKKKAAPAATETPEEAPTEETAE